MMYGRTGQNENRKNSANPAMATPSRAAHGCAEGVETSRWWGIAHRKTAQASDTRKGDDIVRSAGKGNLREECLHA
jgi:hypothetical protein